MMLHLRVRDISGRVRPFVGIRPTEGHVANPEPIEIAQQMDIILNRMAALDAQERGEFVLFMSSLNVCRAERHHHAVGMACCLLVYGVDQVQCLLGVVSLIGCRFYPD